MLGWDGGGSAVPGGDGGISDRGSSVDIGCDRKKLAALVIGWDRGSSAARDQDGWSSASPGCDRRKLATLG